MKCPKTGHKLFTTRSGRLVRSRTQNNYADNEKSGALIYLDLSQPVAVVHKEPLAAASIDEDLDLRHCLNKFLGLAPARRRLYNPLDYFESIESHDTSSTPSDIHFFGTTQSDSLKSQCQRDACVDQRLLQLLTLKMFEDNVQRINASYFKKQAPPQLKEPIELDSLPSEEERARICRRHKRQVQEIQEESQTQYSFLSSLSPDTPNIMCHPLALSYRRAEFDACKSALAQSLFGLFNHVIFYCGLRQRIEWQTNRKLLGSCDLVIGADGERRARFQLSGKIRKAAELIETLLHEMCHAAAFVYNGETGHGNNTRKWAYRAKCLLPQLPLIADCDASWKYCCVLCRRCSCGNIPFLNKQELLRCFHCQFELIVSACRDGVHEMPPTMQSATPYTNFMRAHYSQCEQSGHSSKMRVLNAQYFHDYIKSS